MDEEQKLRNASDGAPSLSEPDAVSEAHEEGYVPPRYTFVAETEDSSVRDKYGLVYDGMNQLSADIRRDVDVFSAVEDMIRRGSGEIALKRQMMRKTLDETWIKVIEDCIIPLDNVIRKPGRFIEENDAVLPIELSHNITSRSLRHLAQHTDYISSVEGDTITPSKILNVFRDETVQTYENRFVNTLINRLYIFVSRRYDAIRENGRASATSVLSYETRFETAAVKGKINLNMEISASSEIEGGASKDTREESELWDRLEHIKQVVSGYANSPFAKTMGKNYIRPPVMHTNAINKNRDLRQCVALWEFIESYEGAGYELSVKDTAEKIDDRFLDEMLSALAVQYCVFRYNMSAEIADEMILSESEDGEPFVPKFLDSLEEYESDDFNVHDTSYKKYMAINQLNPKRKLTVGEWRIRRAIDVALKADRILELKRIADEAERRRKEEEAAEHARMEQEEAARLEREAEEAKARQAKENEAAVIEEMNAKSEAEEQLREIAENEAKSEETEAEREREIEESEEARYARQLEEEKRRAEEVDRRRREAESGLTDGSSSEPSAAQIAERRDEDAEQEKIEELRDRREAMEREKREAEEAAAREAYLAEQARSEGQREETDFAEIEQTERALEEEALLREREAEEARLTEERERARREKEEQDRLAREEAEKLEREIEEDEAARFIREEEEAAYRREREQAEREAAEENELRRREYEESLRRAEQERAEIESAIESEKREEETIRQEQARESAKESERRRDVYLDALRRAEESGKTEEKPEEPAAETPAEEPAKEPAKEPVEQPAEAQGVDPESLAARRLVKKPTGKTGVKRGPKTGNNTRKKTRMKPGAKKTGQKKTRPGEANASPRKKNRKK